jgi:hypothetical protein
MAKDPELNASPPSKERKIPPYKLLKNDTLDYPEVQYGQTFQASDLALSESIKLEEPQVSLPVEAESPKNLSDRVAFHLNNGRDLAMSVGALKQMIDNFVNIVKVELSGINQHIESINASIGLWNSSRPLLQKIDIPRLHKTAIIAYSLEKHSFYSFDKALMLIKNDQVPHVLFPVSPNDLNFPTNISSLTPTSLDLESLQNSIIQKLMTLHHLTWGDAQAAAYHIIDRMLLNTEWSSFDNFRDDLKKGLNTVIDEDWIADLTIQLDALVLARKFIECSAQTFLKNNTLSFAIQLMGEHQNEAYKIKKTALHELARIEFFSIGIDWTSVKQVMADQYLNLIPSSTELANEFVNDVVDHVLNAASHAQLTTLIDDLQMRWEILDPLAKGAIIWSYFRRHGFPANALDPTLLSLALPEINVSPKEMESLRNILINDHQGKSQKSPIEVRADIDSLLLFTVMHGPFDDVLSFIQTVLFLARRFPDIDIPTLKNSFHQAGLPAHLIGTLPYSFIMDKDFSIPEDLIQPHHLIPVNAIDIEHLEESLKKIVILREHPLISKIIFDILDKGPFDSISQLREALKNTFIEVGYDISHADRNAETLPLSLNRLIIVQQLLKIPKDRLINLLQNKPNIWFKELLLDYELESRDLKALALGIQNTALHQLAQFILIATPNEIGTSKLALAFAQITAKGINILEIRQAVIDQVVKSNPFKKQESSALVDQILLNALENNLWRTCKEALLDIQCNLYHAFPKVNFDSIFTHHTNISLPPSHAEHDNNGSGITDPFIEVIRKQSEPIRASVNQLNVMQNEFNSGLTPIHYSIQPKINDSTGLLDELPLVYTDLNPLSLLAKQIHAVLSYQIPWLASPYPPIIIPSSLTDESFLLPLLLNIDFVDFNRIFGTSTLNALFQDFGFTLPPLLLMQLQLYQVKILSESSLVSAIAVYSNPDLNLMRYNPKGTFIQILLSQAFLNEIMALIENKNSLSTIQELTSQFKECDSLSQIQKQAIRDQLNIFFLMHALLQIYSTLQSPAMISNLFNPAFIKHEGLIKENDSSTEYLVESHTKLIMNCLSQELEASEAKRVTDQIVISLLKIKDIFFKESNPIYKSPEVINEFLNPCEAHKVFSYRLIKPARILLTALINGYTASAESSSGYLG